MAKETKVQRLDRYIAPHREDGDDVVTATVKAVRDMRREKKEGKR